MTHSDDELEFGGDNDPALDAFSSAPDFDDDDDGSDVEAHAASSPRAAADDSPGSAAIDAPAADQPPSRPLDDADAFAVDAFSAPGLGFDDEDDDEDFASVPDAAIFAPADVDAAVEQPAPTPLWEINDVVVEANVVDESVSADSARGDTDLAPIPEPDPIFAAFDDYRTDAATVSDFPPVDEFSGTSSVDQDFADYAPSQEADVEQDQAYPGTFTESIGSEYRAGGLNPEALSMDAPPPAAADGSQRSQAPGRKTREQRRAERADREQAKAKRLEEIRRAKAGRQKPTAEISEPKRTPNHAGRTPSDEKSSGGPSRRKLLLGAAAAVVVALAAWSLLTSGDKEEAKSPVAQPQAPSASAPPNLAEINCNNPVEVVGQSIACAAAGDQTSGTNAILAYNAAFYGDRDAAAAYALTSGAQDPASKDKGASVIQKGIDGTPANASHALTITPVEVGKEYSVTLLVTWPEGGTNKAATFQQTITTTERDGKFYIDEIDTV